MIDVYLCVVALADWDLILGEPILRMMQTIIDVTNQMIMIEPKSTDRPGTLSAIPNKTPRRQLVSAALVTIAATDVIPQQDCKWGSGCFVWTSTSTSVLSRNRRGSSTNYYLGVLQWERKRYQCSYYIEVCVLCS